MAYFSPAIGRQGGEAPKYLGNPASQMNIAANVDDTQNCCLWVTNLPPDTTLQELLGSIRGVGRIFYVFLNAPAPHLGHYGAAAKITFFAASAARRLVELAASDNMLAIRGFKAEVKYNRNKISEAQTHVDDDDRL